MKSDNSEWHLSKSVPLSLIMAVGVQTLGVVWFVSNLESDVDTNVRDIARHEIRIAKLEETQQQMAIMNARIDENINAIRAMMETSNTNDGR